MIFSFSRILIVESSLNDSTQSPACSRNARPSITFARLSRRFRASPAKTSGGLPFRRSSAAPAAAASGHSGCWSAVKSRQDEGDQVDEVIVTATSVVTPFLVYFSQSNARLLRNQSLGRQDPWQLLGRLPPVPRHPGAGRSLLLHRRPALDHDPVRARPAPRGDAGRRGDALCDSPRARPLARLR